MTAGGLPPEIKAGQQSGSLRFAGEGRTTLRQGKKRVKNRRFIRILPAEEERCD